MKNGNCYCMDCMAGMAQFPDGFFDLAVVDPPYYSGPERRGYYGSKVSRTGVRRHDYLISPAWKIPERSYFDELRRVAKHYIVWGCNYFTYEFAPGRIVWDKCNQNTSFSDCELAATNLFDSVRLFRYMWNGMMQGKSITEGYIMQETSAGTKYVSTRPKSRWPCMTGLSSVMQSRDRKFWTHILAAEAAGLQHTKQDSISPALKLIRSIFRQKKSDLQSTRGKRVYSMQGREERTDEFDPIR